ncbi:hypothetical protein PTTG_12184 [Puccinia triticina 1-1 BBBD Race 1]|uniref:Uncharacterized protein n=2 Tax=Puccinia triticina TaxID=208348 RepID=A0A180H2Z6_PUCT1|nr:uncharacterized protein PtA15_8A656 [Puccinia triticina]OAV99386.1 hypothetical protein PTTG_12184 [Puccinia triticina 1-1 BBBD Race 1]WAQ87750.1 hypothetical protein PtA15_8A656 [Puccinia triticina]
MKSHLAAVLLIQAILLHQIQAMVTTRKSNARTKSWLSEALDFKQVVGLRSPTRYTVEAVSPQATPPRFSNGSPSSLEASPPRFANANHNASPLNSVMARIAERSFKKYTGLKFGTITFDIVEPVARGKYSPSLNTIREDEIFVPSKPFKKLASDKKLRVQNIKISDTPQKEEPRLKKLSPAADPQEKRPRLVKVQSIRTSSQRDLLESTVRVPDVPKPAGNNRSRYDQKPKVDFLLPTSSKPKRFSCLPCHLIARRKKPEERVNPFSAAA